MFEQTVHLSPIIGRCDISGITDPSMPGLCIHQRAQELERLAREDAQVKVRVRPEVLAYLDLYAASVDEETPAERRPRYVGVVPKRVMANVLTRIVADDSGKRFIKVTMDRQNRGNRGGTMDLKVRALPLDEPKTVGISTAMRCLASDPYRQIFEEAFGPTTKVVVTGPREPSPPVPKKKKSK